MKSLEARKAYRNKQKDLEQQEREIGGLSKEQTFEEGGGSVATNESDVEDSAKNVRPTNEFKDKTLGNDPGLAQREKDLAAARERTAAQQRQASQQAEGSAGGEDEGSGEDDEPMDAEAADEWVNDTVENIKANLSDLSESDLTAVEQAEQRGKKRVSVLDAITKHRDERKARGENWNPGK